MEGEDGVGFPGAELVNQPGDLPHLLPDAPGVVKGDVFIQRIVVDELQVPVIRGGDPGHRLRGNLLPFHVEPRPHLVDADAVAGVLVDDVDDVGAGAVVHPEGVAVLLFAGEPQGVELPHVRSHERIDGLLRVPEETDGTVFGNQTFNDVQLEGGQVLDLVHEDDVEPLRPDPLTDPPVRFHKDVVEIHITVPPVRLVELFLECDILVGELPELALPGVFPPWFEMHLLALPDIGGRTDDLLQANLGVLF